jgi:hypothetical protein
VAVRADELVPLIERAETLPTIYDALKERGRWPQELRGDDFPLVTLHRLEIMARVHYLAVLTLLRRHDLAYAAEDEVRPLLEFLASTAWITGKVSQPAHTPRCRAICLEIGMAKEVLAKLVAAPDKHLASVESRRAMQQRLDSLRDTHGRRGCTCHARTSNSTKMVLRDIAKLAPPFDVFPWLYDALSLGLHLSMYDRMIQPIAPGVSDFVPATDSHRARILSWALLSYGSGLIQILETRSQQAAQTMRDAVREVQADEALRRLGTG